MKKILLGILAAIALLIIVIGVLISRQPDQFRVERRVTIAAPPAAVFANIDDFHHWAAWSPWEKLDPAMNKTYTGPDHGTGAAYTWAGNRAVGSGRMTIVESRAPEKLAIRLEFQQPFPSTNTTLFTLTPKNGSTETEWAMEGPNSLFAKVMGIFGGGMDAFIGKDFERGLGELKRISEGGTAKVVM